eukprot:CAMPEP_0206496754 /NCGR_PEP_ID=MMETSP0324_2-20121206/49660_1 /ASSEMBLY_ACC=CAM_ASM_000836 /TAXON_ID=2866 /ORGANISM="Crypthecodinium cohnii, Strain Seligo" /LENGTH=183 /DNA_ID=CAMNT_0053981957 /DNA_START=558 /DNA_END=1107 /DNA_ORIENTATION=-
MQQEEEEEEDCALADGVQHYEGLRVWHTQDAVHGSIAQARDCVSKESRESLQGFTTISAVPKSYPRLPFMFSFSELGACVERIQSLESILDLALQLLLRLCQSSLLMLAQLADGVNLLNTEGTEGYLGCEVRQVRDVRLDISALGPGFPVEASQYSLAEHGPCIGHGESGAAFASLGVDDLGA